MQFSEEELDKFKGMTLDEAIILARLKGFRTRCVGDAIDASSLELGTDQDRISFIISNRTLRIVNYYSG